MLLTSLFLIAWWYQDVHMVILSINITGKQYTLMINLFTKFMREHDDRILCSLSDIMYHQYTLTGSQFLSITSIQQF